MKIALLTSAFPYPADEGSKLRNLHLLARLSSLGDVYLFSLSREEPRSDQLLELRKRCRELVWAHNRRGTARKVLDVGKSVVLRRPYHILANTSADLRGALRSLLERERIDVIQVAELCMMEHLPADIGRATLVLDAHNAEAIVQERIAVLAKPVLKRCFQSLQAELTRKYESRSAARVNTVLAVSQNDYEYFEPLAERVVLVPNGIDGLEPIEMERSPAIVFTGVLKYPPNAEGLAWFLAEVWPRIAAGLPEASFDIIARNPPAALTRLSGSRVRFLDEVSDVVPLLRRARVMVVPLRAGGGTRLKILQAFAAGLPVVSTAVGAEGLDVTDGEHLFVRDSAEEFASAVVELYRDDARRLDIAGAAQRLVERRYLWDNIFEHCRSLYIEAGR